MKIGDTYSTWRQVRRGLPQGSIFVNDLFYNVKRTKLMAYVDDHQIYNSNKDPVVLDKRITYDVRMANQWYNYDDMIVNASKHQAMVLQITDCQFSFTVKPIDNTLSFGNHINKQFNVMLRFSTN